MLLSTGKGIISLNANAVKLVIDSQELSAGGIDDYCFYC